MEKKTKWLCIITEKVRKDGWKIFFAAVSYQLHLMVIYAHRQLILRNKLIIRFFPFQKPQFYFYPTRGVLIMDQRNSGIIGEHCLPL
jgi:hypothetical protein